MTTGGAAGAPAGCRVAAAAADRQGVVKAQHRPSAKSGTVREG